ncbi:MAG TPA: MMPL family transporter [Acidimicrobiales bacterium]|nr:MMPL family transporter [Acidimicrobiales bacterium]
MLGRFGRWCHNRRGLVLVLWVVLFVGLGGLSSATGSGFSTEFTPPDVESARGLELIDEHFGGQGGGDGGTIVFRTETGTVNDPDVKEAMEPFFEAVGELDSLEVASPYAPGGEGQISRAGPETDRIAFARVDPADEVSVEEAAEITEDVLALEPDLEGVQIEYGGQLFAEFAPPDSEVLGIGFAIVILILAFGSVLAMGLPIATAIAGIGAGASVVTILSNVQAMPDFTTTIGVMIGLGVGIDYALFIVTRYREGLHAGFTTEHAVGVAINTAGRAVLFAGITVVISLMGMLVMQLDFVSGLAIGAAVTVAFTMLASVTLLPALLGFAGHKVEVTRWRGLLAAGVAAVGLITLGLKVLPPAAVALPMIVGVVFLLAAGTVLAPLKREVPRRARKPLEQTLPYRWSRMVQHHSWAAVLLGSGILLVLALPLLSLRLGFADEGNYPEDTSTRRAYDLVARGFGAGFSGPLAVITELGADTPDSVLDRLTEAFQETEGVAFASEPILDDPENPTAAMWQVISAASPQDQATDDLIDRLRLEVIPEAATGTGLDLPVTGFVAVGADFSDYLGKRLPLFLGVVLALSFLLLMAVFRSVVVPLKAVLMNLISIGAAYGVVVAIFQWGWGKDLVGLGKGGPIEPFVPMMMFAIVFGLSMDYEVFLLSRIKEQYDRGATNAMAVADGLASTARVISAAAAIMVFVFGSFLLESDRIIKLFGIGLASAVLLDATIVRLLLVPATMELLGDRNWWLPAWLGRLIPRIEVEGVGADSIDEIEQAEHDEGDGGDERDEREEDSLPV